MLSEISNLRFAGLKVVVVGPAHEFREAVPQFIARRNVSDDETALSIRYFDKTKLLLNSRMNDAISLSGARYVDRIALFCDSRGACELMDEKSQLYFTDSQHLSRLGARFMGEKLAGLSLFE